MILLKYKKVCIETYNDELTQITKLGFRFWDMMKFNDPNDISRFRLDIFTFYWGKSYSILMFRWNCGEY